MVQKILKQGVSIVLYALLAYFMLQILIVGVIFLDSNIKEGKSDAICALRSDTANWKYPEKEYISPFSNTAHQQIPVIIKIETEKYQAQSVGLLGELNYCVVEAEIQARVSANQKSYTITRTLTVPLHEEHSDSKTSVYTIDVDNQIKTEVTWFIVEEKLR